MIDLHSHILPGLCDGSPDLDTSVAMARLAVADGTQILACTPHIYPGLYPNIAEDIVKAKNLLQIELNKREIPLTLVTGADVHMVPEVLDGLRSGVIPTLAGSRYFLLEPAHHTPVVNFLDQVSNFLHAGYVPIITHPERLGWFEKHYQEFVEAVDEGAWIQITAMSLVGKFGRNAKRLAERCCKDGIVHIVASDAHNTRHRPPGLSEAVMALKQIINNEDEVQNIVHKRPSQIIDDEDPNQYPCLRAQYSLNESKVRIVEKKTWWEKVFGQ